MTKAKKIAKGLLMGLGGFVLFSIVMVTLFGTTEDEVVELTTTTTVAAVAPEVTTTTAVPTTTTTQAPTTTTTAAEVELNIDWVIMMTRVESNTYSSTTWVDVTDDETLAEMAEIICQGYVEVGDKEAVVVAAAEAYFEGYTVGTADDVQLFVYFAGGVIDLLCEEIHRG